MKWTKIRFKIIFEVLLVLKHKRGYVTAAFLHEDIGKVENIYMGIPKGLRIRERMERIRY